MNRITWKKINSFAKNYKSIDHENLRTCPICGSNHSKTIMNLESFQFYLDSDKTPKLFDVKESICLSCYAVYLNPCYSQSGFNDLFSEAGQSYGSTEEHTDEQINWLKDNNLLNEGNCVLDVGCYDGNFLSKLPKKIKKVGVDIDEPAIKRGKKRHQKANIKFFLGDFETFFYDEIEPDTITMYHVLEHLPRPVEVLKKLHSISKPTTKIVVEVPIIEDGNTNDINGFFSIQHTTHFSSNSLLNCMTLAGWEVKKIHKTDDYNGYRVIGSISTKKVDHSSLTLNKKDWISLNSSLSSWYSAIDSVEKVVQNIKNTDKFVIWGGGAHTEYLYQTTSFFHIYNKSDFIIIDSDPIKHGKTWRGLNVYDPSILNKIDWTNTSLIISSYGGQESIAEEACKIGIPDVCVIKLYETIRRY